MSVRADSGVCRHCGVVMLVAEMTRLEGATGYDAYACPECGSKAPRKSSGGRHP